MPPNLSRTEKPRATTVCQALTREQLDELVWRIEDQLGKLVAQRNRAPRAARQVIDPVFLDTPLYRCEALEPGLGCTVSIKLETANPVRSFKARGTEVIASLLAGTGPRAVDRLAVPQFPEPWRGPDDYAEPAAADIPAVDADVDSGSSSRYGCRRSS